MFKKLKELIEGLNWGIERTEQKEDYVYEISKYSKLGEDFSFSVVLSKEATLEEIIAEIKKYASDFDAEDHAEMHIENRGRGGTPTSIKSLLEDAEDIKKELEMLSDGLDE